MRALCHQWRSRAVCQAPTRHLELERHHGQRLMGTAGQLRRLAGTRPLQELKEIVLVAALDLDLVDELRWALVGQLMIERWAR